MLSCISCGNERFLIRGLCEQCAPQSHRSHRFLLDVIGDLACEFEQETGLSSLVDVDQFEMHIECDSKLRIALLDGDSDLVQLFTQLVRERLSEEIKLINEELDREFLLGDTVGEPVGILDQQDKKVD